MAKNTRLTDEAAGRMPRLGLHDERHADLAAQRELVVVRLVTRRGAGEHDVVAQFSARGTLVRLGVVLQTKTNTCSRRSFTHHAAVKTCISCKRHPSQESVVTAWESDCYLRRHRRRSKALDVRTAMHGAPIGGIAKRRARTSPLQEESSSSSGRSDSWSPVMSHDWNF